MELREIATIAGKPGLFRVVKPARNGVIVESLDATKTRILATVSSRISILQEISIYTNTVDEAIALQDVFYKMHEQYKDQELPVHAKSSGADLLNFLETIVPEFDAERVYPSDVKKLINWYQILVKQCPEVLEPQQKEETEKTEADAETSEVK
jgi:hypothetical protein